jgi:tight adherence protein C
MDFNTTSTAVFLAIFAGVLALGYILSSRQDGDRRKSVDRLRRLSEAPDGANAASRLLSRIMTGVPMLGNLASARQEQLAQFRTKLLRAGYFQAGAPQIFMGARMLLMLLLTAAGLGAAFMLDRSVARDAALFCLIGCGVGFLAPNVWLSAEVARHQRRLRSALPDALDMLVLCLEGGVSINAAIQRITDELHFIHPELMIEMNIIQREMQMGLSTGEAFRKFADRCGLPDVRDLAVIMIQSERYGASITKALRTYADNSRVERQQKAEELAQKAAVKILFPTLLFIFPAIFIVVLGPAAFQTAHMFKH